MQILAISDTHSDYMVLERVMLSHRDAELFLHCGDGEAELEMFLRVHEEFAPRTVFVRGNCDYDSLAPLITTVPLPFGHRLVLLHGHRYIYGDFRQNLVELARQEQADIVVFGHLHARIDETREGIRLFNPGSAANPRDGKPPSFGLIDILESGILTSHGDL